jgi:hypothetical protein
VFIVGQPNLHYRRNYFRLFRQRWSEAGFCLALTPGSDSACHDRQSNPTGGGPYHLTDHRDDVEAIQGWDQELEDCCANNSAYSSRNHVSGGQIEIPLEDIAHRKAA